MQNISSKPAKISVLTAPTMFTRMIPHGLAAVLLSVLLPAMEAETNSWKAAAAEEEARAINLPQIGDFRLRVLSPDWIEMERITGKEPEPAPVEVWDFTDAARMPSPKDFEVLVDGVVVPVAEVSFRRRPVFAPLRGRDLRIGNWLSLRLETPVPEGSQVVVRSPRADIVLKDETWNALSDPQRYSPVIHANQDVYPVGMTKRAYAGYFLGSAGELPVGLRNFRLIDLSTGKPGFEGVLRPRPDSGFVNPHYQQVMEADFTAFDRPGRYVLAIDGIGASLPFWIAEEGAGLMARTLALGIYHQRSGAPGKSLPYTRFTHGPSHVLPAAVPTVDSTINRFLEGTTEGVDKDEGHPAPRLSRIDRSLYPILRTGEIDVSGGHHDAGDYSKYTINSASFIHALVFAADALPGIGDLDNLGIPESGDGISDVLQMALWEADFLAKMQDEDGGFFFLVYPRERKYEGDVPPDQADRQVVYPKNTAATAAATAALAQIASSPRFRKAFPERAEAFLAAARRGWKFVQEALEKHGWEGSYQKITHYGDTFRHDDEILWAAAEMAGADGNEDARRILKERFAPDTAAWRRWGWWRMPESYGNATRAIAFAESTGRLAPDPAHVAAAKSEAVAAADQALASAEQSAYGISFPVESKRMMTAGWFFPSDTAFDLAVGHALTGKEKYLEAIDTNLGYEAGANPVNMPRITGIGAFRQRDIVHQHSQNTWQELPVSGIPIGSLTTGAMWLDPYKKELGGLTFPPDTPKDPAYPLYDRWADSFNVLAEFVIINQARSLATAAYRMASRPTGDWKPVQANLEGLPNTIETGQSASLNLQSPLDPSETRLVWESSGDAPSAGPEFSLTRNAPGMFRVDAEAYDPRGRRVFASKRGRAGRPGDGDPAQAGPETALLLDFNEENPLANDAIVVQGEPVADPAEVGWMEVPAGASLRFSDFDQAIAVALDAPIENGFRLSARIKMTKSPHGRATVPLLAVLDRDRVFGLRQTKWPPPGQPGAPHIVANQQVLIPSNIMDGLLSQENWHLLEIDFSTDLLVVRIDGIEIASVPSGDLPASETPKTLVVGNFIGWVDDIHLQVPQ